MAYNGMAEMQNRIRGAVSDYVGKTRYKTGKKELKKPPNPEEDLRYYRIAINDCYLEARKFLRESDFSHFLDWANNYIRLKTPSFFNKPINTDYLHHRPGGPRIALRKELLWLVSRINLERKAVDDFVRRKNIATRFVMTSEIGQAIQAVDEISNLIGDSLWSTKLRIALEHLHNGLEGHKRYVANIRRQHRRGFLQYVAYYISVRNEDRTSISAFRSEVDKRFDKLVTAQLSAYTRFHLFNEWPEDPKEVSKILMMEQKGPIIDIYETFISYIQESIRLSFDKKQMMHIASAVDLLKVHDYRLEKVRLALGLKVDTSQFETRESQIGDILFGTAPENAPRAALRETFGASDPWQIIYAALALSLPNRRFIRRKAGALSFAKALSASFINGFLASSEGTDAERIALNLSGLAPFKGICDFISEMKTKSITAQPALHLVDLNSEVLGPESVTLQSEGLSTQAGPTTAAWRILDTGLTSDSKLLNPITSSWAQSFWLEKLQEHDAASDCLVTTVNSQDVPGSIRHFADALLFRCRYGMGDRTALIELIANEAIAPGSVPPKQIVEAIGAYQFSDYRALGLTMQTIVAIFYLHKISNSDLHASILRFATSRFLKSTTWKKPSAVADHVSEYPLDILIYFLWYVCVPSTIDVSGLFQNSKEVMVERQAICGVLASIDEKNIAQYDGEIFSITHRMRINEGLEIIDRNRIYVDTDSIGRWAKSSLGQMFLRYRDLNDIDVDDGDMYDQLLKEISQSGKVSRELVFTPVGEADGLLIALVGEIKEEFLHNSSYGLDYYVSKRIRHQSFVGRVRDPLEVRHIITTRATGHSNYNPNAYWLGRLTPLSDNRRIDEHFQAFSKFFDEKLNDIKDRRFHARSAEKPDGIFDIVISSPLLVVTRALSRSDETIDDFLRTVFAIFWGVLAGSLETAKRIISEDLKMGLSEALNKLRIDIGNLVLHDSAFQEFSLSISQATTELQAALGETEAWFERPETETSKHRFTLRVAIDVAVESALKSNRVLQPRIVYNVSDNVVVGASDLIFINDAIWVAFGNMRKHNAGLTDPLVSINCSLNSDKSALRIEIINSVSPKLNIEEHEARMKEIREMIKKGATGKRSRNDEGSGFIKLSPIIRQSSMGRLEFGFIPERRFRLFVQYSWLAE
ncbi:hypothetical protein [Mesorhizobium sp. WSM4904]|uniref:hypothetical protein n=1 Tax=Mesorhizobium sp. WSM4904 TaxID=3038545 RepID=UPI002418BC13|nr:hypothetical protein [Mesorhizobium sp. WSM4904]WFP65116.1 hypothetical protein QAZ47_11575 [Mesorhizobium sp. WSM4904]